MNKVGTIRLEDPRAKITVDFMKNLNVGDVFNERFMPALPAKMDWKCVKATDKYWRFEGTFCGIAFKTIEVNIVGHMLMMNDMAGVS